MPIGVKQVGLILVDQIGHAVEIMLAPRIGNAVVVPLVFVVAAEAGAIGIVIQIRKRGIGAVVGDAGQGAGLVGAVADGKPLVTDP